MAARRGGESVGKFDSIVMKVSQLTMDPFTNVPLLILADAEGKLAVPIWIGPIEARAIASEMEKISLQRPMTHDLMKTLVGACGAKVLRVEIHDVRADTYYAAIVLQTADGARQVDARPADAIALALRTSAPIRVACSVVDKAQKLDLPPNGCSDRDMLESLSDEEFGKWKM